MNEPDICYTFQNQNEFNLFILWKNIFHWFYIIVIFGKKTDLENNILNTKFQYIRKTRNQTNNSRIKERERKKKSKHLVNRLANLIKSCLLKVFVSSVNKVRQ